MCSGHLTTTDGRVLGRPCLTSCPACPSMVACLPGSLRQMDRLPSGPPFSLQTALASGTSFPDGLSDGVEALVTHPYLHQQWVSSMPGFLFLLLASWSQYFLTHMALLLMLNLEEWACHGQPVRIRGSPVFTVDSVL